MTLAQNHRNTAFDLTKCVAAFLVVFIHYAPKDSLFDAYLNAICRIAVPLFFVITGYYYDSLRKSNKLKSYIIKIIKVTVVASCFYLVFFIVKQYIDGRLIEWLTAVFSLRSVIKWLFFNEFPVVFHLWYLYALIYALWANVVADRVGLTRYLPYIAIGLLIMDFLLMSDVRVSSLYVRNWALMGFPFVICGRFLYSKQAEIRDMNVPAWALFLIVTVSLVLLFFERSLLQKVNMPLRDLYICVIPIVLSIAILSIKYPTFGSNSVFTHIGKEYSSDIYLYHVFIGIVVLSVYSNTNNVIIQYFMPLLIFVISLLFNMAVKFVKSKRYLRTFGFSR